jgi:hydroxyquinol 1,2-dioxygenase
MMASDARLTDAIERIAGALRGLVVDLDPSQDEWMTALAFLNDVGRADEFILLSDVLGLSVFVDERAHLGDGATTASNVQGPFYLPGAPLLEARYRLADEGEHGEPLVFTGRVSDADTGSALAGALLEVWQADDDALYDVQTRTPNHTCGVGSRPGTTARSSC